MGIEEACVYNLIDKTELDSIKKRRRTNQFTECQIDLKYREELGRKRVGKGPDTRPPWPAMFSNENSPFGIERIGDVVYCLVLQSDISLVHPSFHVYMLRKCISGPSHVILRRLQNKEILMVKVMWLNHFVEEYTWETESDMRKRYPFPFN
ncbi:uncharacterized protein LOC126681822 [Mercurialis annua]|uniref:uncharacterized protein LOC126681822 n=1 Tax=Mercurialis annua TaxID=3986 RepID=UPI00215E831F|nr:uncharacterized protein LOC126681822 [Mercurialis annua]